MKSPKFTKEAITEAAIKATALERSLGIVEKKSDPIPPGYRAREEWGKIWGCNQSATCLRIKAHVASGRMKQIKLAAVDISGRQQQKPFYKAIK